MHLLQRQRREFEARLQLTERQQEAGWYAENNDMSEEAKKVFQASAWSCMQAATLPKLR